MGKTVCVYASSSNSVDEIFFQVAENLGIALAKEGYDLVYGGAKVGLMGKIAEIMQQAGRKVTGVIPKLIYEKNLAYNEADELLVTEDMRERKAEMEKRADVFIAIPGGFGTLEEILEVLTLKQLHYHNKPLIFLNINGCFDPLNQQFELFYQNKFAKPSSRQMYYFATSVEELIHYLRKYQPLKQESKWFDK